MCLFPCVCSEPVLVNASSGLTFLCRNLTAESPTAPASSTSGGGGESGGGSADLIPCPHEHDPTNDPQHVNPCKVRENALLEAMFGIKRPIYQDRLGTNMFGTVLN